MHRQELFSIADFARLSRTNRNTLIYYDNIGLLHPILRKRNGCRYYSSDQLAIVSLIVICQSLDMPLADIRKLIEKRTPARMNELLKKQLTRVDEKVIDLERKRHLIKHWKDTIASALKEEQKGISIKLLPEKVIILGEPNDYSKGWNDYDALRVFYKDCLERYPQLDLSYPVWGYFSEERVKGGDWNWPDRYYFSNPAGEERRSAGLYAVGYSEGCYGQNKELYKKLKDFIDEKGYEISGPAWEEYPLNEISLTEKSRYITRLLISVRKTECGGLKRL